MFWNCGQKCTRPFQPVVTKNTALEIAGVGRGAVYGDLDQDGDLDIVVTNVGRKPSVIRNDLETRQNNWLNIRLKYKGANLNAIGATVQVTSDGSIQTREITRTRSYLSQFEASAHFGLGQQTITSVEVKWPDGRLESFGDIAPNQSVTLAIGSGTLIN